MTNKATKRPAPSWDATIRGIKRDAILNAAREVFQECGLEGASMRSIALKAGCTTGAVYPLFPSKERIYAELLEQSLSSLNARVAAAHSNPGRMRPHEAAARAFVAYYGARPYEVNLGLYAFNGLKRLGVGKEPDRALNEALSATVRLLSPHPAKSAGGAPDMAAMVAFAQLIGVLVLHQSGRLRLGRCAPDAVVDHFLMSRRIAANEELPE